MNRAMSFIAIIRVEAPQIVAASGSLEGEESPGSAEQDAG